MSSNKDFSDKTDNAIGDASEQTKKGIDKTDNAFDNASQKAKRGIDKTDDAFDNASQKAKSGVEKAEGAVKNANETFWQKLEEDGVVNPKGLSMFAFGGLFLAAVPVTSWLTQSGGLLEKTVNGVISSVGFLGTAGSSSTVPQTGKIAALGALYVTVTYALSGAGSAAGVDAGNKEGRDNNYPRSQVANLRGLPLRLYSAHYNLLEMFPGWAISAALAQAMAPGDQGLINLLGLHVISKVFVYYPSYIFNVGPLRSAAHVFATASVINVALRLAKKPLV